MTGRGKIMSSSSLKKPRFAQPTTPTLWPCHDFISRRNVACDIRLESPRGVDEFWVKNCIYWVYKASKNWTQSWKKMLQILSFLKLGFAISPSFEIIRLWNFMGRLLGPLGTQTYKKLRRKLKFYIRPILKNEYKSLCKKLLWTLMVDSF